MQRFNAHPGSSYPNARPFAPQQTGNMAYASPKRNDLRVRNASAPHTFTNPMRPQQLGSNNFRQQPNILGHQNPAFLSPNANNHSVHQAQVISQQLLPKNYQGSPYLYNNQSSYNSPQVPMSQSRNQNIQQNYHPAPPAPFNLNLVQDQIHCVVCSETYFAHQLRQHVQKHKRIVDPAKNSRRLGNPIINHNLFTQPKPNIIVQPEEFNIQYTPNKYVLNYENNYQTEYRGERNPVMDEGVDTQSLGYQSIKQVRHHEPISINERPNQQILHISTPRHSNYKSSRRDREDSITPLPTVHQQYHPEKIRLSDAMQTQNISTHNHHQFNHQRRPKDDVMGSGVSHQSSNVIPVQPSFHMTKSSRISQNHVPDSYISNNLQSQHPINNNDSMNYRHDSSRQGSNIDMPYRQSHISRQQPSYISRNGINEQNSNVYNNNPQIRPEPSYRQSVNIGQNQRIEQSLFNSKSFRQSSMAPRSYNKDNYNSQSMRHSNIQQSYREPVNIGEEDRMQESIRNSKSFRQSSIAPRSYNKDNYNSQYIRPSNGHMQQSYRQSVHIGDDDRMQESIRNSKSFRESSMAPRSYNQDNYNNSQSLKHSNNNKHVSFREPVDLGNDGIMQESIGNSKSFRESSMAPRSYDQANYNSQSMRPSNGNIQQSYRQSIHLGDNDRMQESIRNQKSFRESSMASRSYNQNNYNSQSIRPSQKHVSFREPVDLGNDNIMQESIRNSKMYNTGAAIPRSYAADDYQKQPSIPISQIRAPSQRQKIELGESGRNHQYQNSKYNRGSAANSRSYKAQDYQRESPAFNQLSSQKQSISFGDQSQNFTYPNSTRNNQRYSRSYNQDDYNRSSHVPQNNSNIQQQQQQQSHRQPVHLGQSDRVQENYNNSRHYSNAVSSRKYNTGDYSRQPSNPQESYRKQISFGQQDQPQQQFQNSKSYRSSAVSHRNYQQGDYEKPSRQPVNLGEDGIQQSYHNSKNYRNNSIASRNYRTDDYSQGGRLQTPQKNKYHNSVISFEEDRQGERISSSKQIQQSIPRHFKSNNYEDQYIQPHQSNISNNLQSNISNNHQYNISNNRQSLYPVQQQHPRQFDSHNPSQNSRHSQQNHALQSSHIQNREPEIHNSNIDHRNSSKIDHSATQNYRPQSFAQQNKREPENQKKKKLPRTFLKGW